MFKIQWRHYGAPLRVTPCWTPRHVGSSHQNWARPTEFSGCCTDRLEL